MRARIRLILLRVVGALLRRIPRRPAGLPRRILVIKPDHLGDVLLLTPALHVLRQRLPEARIVLLIGPWSGAAVAHNADVDAILTCPFPGFTRAPQPRLSEPYRLLLKQAWLLRAGRFDTALIARDDHWWGALLATLAGIPRRIGYAVPEVAPFLSDALPHSFNDHVTAQSLALVQQLTGEAIPVPPALVTPIGAADRAWAAQRIAQLQLDSQPLVAIHPGAGGAAKQWLPARWAAIADALASRGCTIILTGGEAERMLVTDIESRMSHAPIVLVGETTLGQLAALYERCALVLGVDSGPLHLAASTGAATIALFGPGDQRRFGPWGDPARHVVIRSGLWCSPCGVMTACPRGTAPSECMSRITLAPVLDAATNLLAPRA